jgi:processive 1,2-diacylglycerol beta-glucosyltransferase
MIDVIYNRLPASDVVVTKPGGLTSSECLASGSAMLIVEPIPGQENRNADFLLENGCAVKVNNLASLPLKLATVLGDPMRLAKMRESSRANSRPNAAFDIAADCLKYLREPVGQMRAGNVGNGDEAQLAMAMGNSHI